jgi:hypothetical protein
MILWIMFLVGLGLVGAGLLSLLPPAAMYTFIVSVVVWSVWISWPFVGFHRCKTCGTREDIVPLFNNIDRPPRVPPNRHRQR